MCLLFVKGLNVEVMPSDFDENLHKSLFECPSDYVKETALQKALCVAQALRNEPVSTVCFFPIFISTHLKYLSVLHYC